MSLTLKQTLDMMIQSCGLIAPPSWTQGQQDDLQCVALANQAVLSLRERKFQAQLREYSFTTSEESTRYAPPLDSLGIVPDTMWMQSSIWRVDFPTDPTVWAYLRASAGPSGVVIRARMIQNAIEIWQPQDGIPIGYEYYTKNCVFGYDAGFDPPIGVPKELFTTDQDTHVFDDALLIADIKWRYKKEKGFNDWQVDFEAFKAQLNTVMGRDAGAKTIQPLLPRDPSPHANLWVYP